MANINGKKGKGKAAIGKGAPGKKTSSSAETIAKGHSNVQSDFKGKAKAKANGGGAASSRVAGKKAGISKAQTTGVSLAAAAGVALQKSQHAAAIAGYHTILKRIAQASDPEEKRSLQVQLEREYGGLEGYQKQSLTGRDTNHAGETGKWLAQKLGQRWQKRQEVDGKRKMRLLDVGSLSGTAYSKFKWMDATSIDLNPQSESVIAADFFTYPPPNPSAEVKGELEAMYDCVSLSLVLNFVGDLFARGQMLVRPHDFLTAEGYLYVVLPLACVSNSRYLDHARLRSLLSACGWTVVEQEDSARLTRWICQRKSPVAKAKWNGTVFKKEPAVRQGSTYNNFCIRIGGEQQAPVKGGSAKEAAKEASRLAAVAAAEEAKLAKKSAAAQANAFTAQV